MNGRGGCRVEVDRVGRGEWSSWLGLFDDASLYQTWDYAAVVFPEQRISHLVLRDGEEIAGLAQVRLVTLPFLSRGIAYVTWGPVWRRRGAPGAWGTFAALVDALKEEYAHRRRLVLTVVPNVTEPDGRRATDALEAAGFTPAGAARPYRTSLIDVSRRLDEIRGGLAQKWRNCLNSAERNGLEVTRGTSSEEYCTFLSIYHELVDRKRFETNVDADRWALLQEALPDRDKLHIFLAYRGGEALAGLIVSAIGERGIYLLGATRAEALKLKASYLLQWRAIEWLKDHGCRLYDLGGVEPDRNPGVYRFKRRMGGEEVSHIGAFEYCESRLSRAVVLGGQALRSAKRVFRRRGPN